MTPRRVTTLRLDDRLLDGLKEVWDREGILVSEQIRRAVQIWLRERGIEVELELPRQGRRPWTDDERDIMKAWDDFSSKLEGKSTKVAGTMRIPEEVYPPFAGVAIRDLSLGQLTELTRFLGRLGQATSKFTAYWTISKNLPRRMD